MKKNLREIVDADGIPIKSSASHEPLKIPYVVPTNITKPAPQTETKQYLTCYCFPKSLQNHFYNLKAKLFKIIEYIPKII